MCRFTRFIVALRSAVLLRAATLAQALVHSADALNRRYACSVVALASSQTLPKRKLQGALARKAVVARPATETMEDCGVGEEIKSK